jgi:hypothetical protein
MPENYQPGNCNIGEKEVAIRKKGFGFFVVITLAFSVLVSLYCHSITCWLILLFSSFILIVLYLQIKYRFCILFGFFNLYNFEHPGNLNEVTCKEDSKKDRKRVSNILIRALLSATAYTVLLYLLIMQHHS